ncbi:MAG: phage tail protein, partial [Bryobacteraceae bacterium]
MANGFVVNANRFDPYKNFRFTLEWDGKEVLGVSKVSALKRTTDVVKY